MNNRNINKDMETNPDVLNRLLNLDANANDEGGTSSNRINNVIPVPLYVAADGRGNFNNGETQERNASRYISANLPQIQPNNQPEIYLPALCLIPLRLYGADNITIFAQRDNGLSPPFSAENEGFTPNQRLMSSSLNADTTSVHNTQTSPLFESSLDTYLLSGTSQDHSGSSANRSNNLSGSSFEELTMFPISNAPLDCVWPGSKAVINQSSLHSSGNTSSFEEISFGEELHTYPNVMNERSTNAAVPLPPSLQPQTSEFFLKDSILRRDYEDYPELNGLLKDLINATNAEGNAFVPRRSNTSNQSYNTGAVPKKFCNKPNYPFVVENGSKSVKPVSCKFCFKNKEPEYLYNSHELKSDDGIIRCPILRNYVCPICGISGDFAHTVRYCPTNPKNKLYNQNIHLTEEQNIVQLPAVPNISLTRLPPLSYFKNVERQPVSSKTPETYSDIPKQLETQSYFVKKEEVHVENASCIPCNLSSNSNNDNRSSSPTVKYDRFTCAFPSANIFKRKKKVCKFCLRNKEPDFVYNSHQLRDEAGRIVCPYLRRFVCHICGATGDDAHTRKYCPNNTYEEFIQKFMYQ